MPTSTPVEPTEEKTPLSQSDAFTITPKKPTNVVDLRRQPSAEGTSPSSRTPTAEVLPPKYTAEKKILLDKLRELDIANEKLAELSKEIDRLQKENELTEFRRKDIENKKIQFENVLLRADPAFLEKYGLAISVSDRGMQLVERTTLTPLVTHHNPLRPKVGFIIPPSHLEEQPTPKDVQSNQNPIVSEGIPTNFVTDNSMQAPLASNEAQFEISPLPVGEAVEVTPEVSQVIDNAPKPSLQYKDAVAITRDFWTTLPSEKEGVVLILNALDFTVASIPLPPEPPKDPHADIANGVASNPSDATMLTNFFGSTAQQKIMEKLSTFSPEQQKDIIDQMIQKTIDDIMLNDRDDTIGNVVVAGKTENVRVQLSEYVKEITSLASHFGISINLEDSNIKNKTLASFFEYVKELLKNKAPVQAAQ